MSDDVRFSRQSSIVPPAELRDHHMVVVGVGAVGRQLALQAAALGVRRISLVDADEVELHNCTSQGFPTRQIGLKKVEAVAQSIRELYEATPDYLPVVSAHPEWFRSIPKYDGMDGSLSVMATVDSIDVRQSIWEDYREHGLGQFFGDARVGDGAVQVYCCHDDEDSSYQDSLFPAEETAPGRCTARMTVYYGAVAAGLLLGLWAEWLRGGSPQTSGSIQFNNLPR
jgi:molybdopterin/thiamine biosynthesis adenylyltransferase